MGNLGFSKKDNKTRCKNSAIYSLAMREHSRYELKNKLVKKDYADGVDLETLLDELEESDYLSDIRFAESYIRSKIAQGKGKVKIVNDLKQRGVSASIISDALAGSDVNWFDLASSVREKKFGIDMPSDYREKTKQMRFLSNRGFDSEIIIATVGT